MLYSSNRKLEFTTVHDISLPKYRALVWVILDTFVRTYTVSASIYIVLMVILVTEGMVTVVEVTEVIEVSCGGHILKM
jgi:hypothetical protein